MKRIILTLLTLLTVGLAVPAMHAPLAFADAKSEVCGGVGAASGGSGCSATGTSIDDIISAVVRILSIIAGIAGVVMIIIAGFKYITSGGDSSKISSAKNTLIYAIVGLVIAAMSQFLVKFVLNKAK